MFQSNGDIYRGNWKTGKKEGYGYMMYKNGKLLEGMWKRGKRKERVTDVIKSWINAEMKAKGAVDRSFATATEFDQEL